MVGRVSDSSDSASSESSSSAVISGIWLVSALSARRVFRYEGQDIECEHKQKERTYAQHGESFLKQTIDGAEIGEVLSKFGLYDAEIIESGARRWE